MLPQKGFTKLLQKLNSTVFDSRCIYSVTYGWRFSQTSAVGVNRMHDRMHVYFAVYAKYAIYAIYM